MENRKQKRETRKRSLTPIDEQMKKICAEEEQLSKILFGGSSSFLKSLQEAESEPAKSSTNYDSGLGETDSDDSQKGRKPAWVDEDDGIDVGSALDTQNRTLPDGGVNSRQNSYSNLLRNKYLKIVGTPSWASLDKRDENDESDDELVRSTGFLRKRAKIHLPGEFIELKKVKNLNHDTTKEGPYINVVEFHPTSTVSFVGGSSGVCSLYTVDGVNNHRLHGVRFVDFPIRCARFSNDGNQVMVGSTQRYLYVYDLMAATTCRRNFPKEITHWKHFQISPDGKFVALAGRYGEVHLFSAASLEKIKMLKQNDEVTALSFNSDGSLLYGHSNASEVTIWDMKMQRMRHKWHDEGCIQGSTIDLSSSNQFVATGSHEGVVNLYETADVLKSRDPTPIKRILNLTTPIKTLKFNPTSELIAYASADLPQAVKLFHIGTKSVFSNFPNSVQRLDQINVVNFSPGSGYFALGNTKSLVALYRLKHYKSY